MSQHVHSELRKEASTPKSEGGKTFHLRLVPGSVAPMVLVVGAPYRARLIMERFDPGTTHLICSPWHRGYAAYTGMYKGIPITVCSHGIGGPSIGCVLLDLVEAGGRCFIRVGSCASLDQTLDVGDVAIINDVTRDYDGTSFHWISDDQQTLASGTVLWALEKIAKQNGVLHKVGAAVTTSCFREGQGRENSLGLLEQWQAGLHQDRLDGDEIIYEMEIGPMFARLKSLQPEFGNLWYGAVCAVYANRHTNMIQDGAGDQEAIATALGAVELLEAELSLPEYSFPDFWAAEYQFDRTCNDVEFRFYSAQDGRPAFWRTVGSETILLKRFIVVVHDDMSGYWNIHLGVESDATRTQMQLLQIQSAYSAFERAVIYATSDQLMRSV